MSRRVPACRSWGAGGQGTPAHKGSRKRQLPPELGLAFPWGHVPGPLWPPESTCWARRELCHRELWPGEGVSPSVPHFPHEVPAQPWDTACTEHTVRSSWAFPRDPHAAPTPLSAMVTDAAWGWGRATCVCSPPGEQHDSWEPFGRSGPGSHPAQ